jgi:hypothetical protein
MSESAWRTTGAEGRAGAHDISLLEVALSLSILQLRRRRS